MVIKMKIRYFFARICGKLAKLGLKILRRKIPYYPGYVALKICPDFLKLCKKPKTIIAVTGTNGKTTICALLKDSLEKLGNKVINNNGFNMDTGIATMYLNQKGKTDIAILEVDEKTSGEIFESSKPSYLICTNLFRDSMKTNSNIDYITSLIVQGLPNETKLILNADDLLVVNIGNNRNNIYFGIEKPLKKQPNKTLFKDLLYCPKCDSKLEYLDIKNFHIGNVKCNNCGYTNPKRDYNCEILDDGLLINNYKYNIKNTSIFNVYNYIAVISLLLELNYSKEDINKVLENSKITDSRFKETKVKNTTIINHIAKGQNPVAVSSVLEYVINEKGSKDVLLMLDDTSDNRYSSETINWYYDSNFELLNNESINKIIIGGKRHKDLYIRLLLAKIPKEKIIKVDNEYDMPKYIDKNIDKIFLLHDITSFDQSLEVERLLKEVINND